MFPQFFRVIKSFVPDMKQNTISEYNIAKVITNYCRNHIGNTILTIHIILETTDLGADR